jgi:hypothetical protein
MPTQWDDALVYDPEIAAALAQNPVKNGELARGALPLMADAMHAAAMAGLPPIAGTSCRFGTTERRMRFIRPPFATRALVVLIAGGDGTLTVEVVSGGSGTATLVVDTDSGVENAGIYQLEDVLVLNASDICDSVELEVSRSGSGVQAYAVALLWGGWSL